MIHIVLFSVTIFSLAFGVAAFLLRPTTKENAMTVRVAKLLISSTSATITDNSLDSHLATVKPGAIPWLDEATQNTSLARLLQLLILQSDSDTSLSTIVLIAAVMAVSVAFFTYGISRNFLTALLVGMATSLLPILWLKWKRRKRLAAFDAALPACIDMCGRALRAGNSMIGAIDVVAQEAEEPAKTEFSEVFKKQNYGLPLREALLQMLERVPSPDLRVFVTGILVQKDTGGNLADILDRIVFVIHERGRIQGEIRTHTAQGRLTGWILSLLPLALLLVINLLNPGYSSPMFHNLLGKRLLYVGVCMLMLGIFTIRRIINGIEV